MAGRPGLALHGDCRDKCYQAQTRRFASRASTPRFDAAAFRSGRTPLTSRFMGRGISFAPPPVEAVRQSFALRQDGEIVRRECHIAALKGEPCVFIGPAGRMMARLTHEGKVRRVLASWLAYVLTHDQWPIGPVKTKNGDPTDLRAENLVETRHGAHRPQADAGRASSLTRRQAANAALLNALAERASPSLSELSEATGLSEGRVSTRLSKLAAQGLCEGPQCCPNRSWALTERGKALTKVAIPVVIDALDKRILRALCWAPMRQLVLVREVEVCSLTIRRRTALLIERGLVRRDLDRGPFLITDRGRALLGDDAPTPWVRIEAVAASLAKDVTSRSSPGVLSNAERSRLGGLARAAAMWGRPRAYAATG